MQNSWYDSCSWYDPLYNAESRASGISIPAEKDKKHIRNRRIAGIICLALVLGASLAYALFKSPDASFTVDSYSFNSGEDYSFPDDFKDFFDSYYTSETAAAADVRISEIELRPSWQMSAGEDSKVRLELQELYALCSPSIVGIEGFKDGEAGYSWGTGVILTEDGIILTNTHVIDDCDTATVLLSDGEEFEVELIGADAVSDIALLKIDASDLPTAVFGISSDLQVGDEVAAIGNPLGNSLSLTMTDGIVSAINRNVTYNGRTMTLLQTNTALNEGNSGGALFNMQGQVIGITNMKMMSSYSSIEGIGFAIPSDTIIDVVNQLISSGEVVGRPSIGISVGSIPENVKVYYDMPDGVYVASVSEDSDAQNQGILPGDIVTAVNGEPVKTSDEINDIKNAMSVGDSIVLTIWRDGETFDVSIKLLETNDVYK